ncbi:hypothetical protein [Arthrobacter sp. NEB 688]|uniref:hypothetical protein n=1 Tax=Arthrobacter sp. NEB 688 TaxID=904039 RepID=UPI001564B8CD|nr:hypothetical protein [Arthrobacter sp. NEB 688]QKE84386.1 hypothetical protein HL663_10875 [Arthrobacter sp. NEB 688]
MLRQLVVEGLDRVELLGPACGDRAVDEITHRQPSPSLVHPGEDLSDDLVVVRVDGDDRDKVVPNGVDATGALAVQVPARIVVLDACLAKHSADLHTVCQ